MSSVQPLIKIDPEDQLFSDESIGRVIDPSEDLRGELVEGAIVPNMKADKLEGAIFSNCYLSPDLRLPPSCQVYHHIRSFAVVLNNLKREAVLPQTVNINSASVFFDEGMLSFEARDAFGNRLQYRVPQDLEGNSLTDVYNNTKPHAALSGGKTYDLQSYRFKDIIFDAQCDPSYLVDPVFFIVGQRFDYEPFEELPISYEGCTFINFKDNSRFPQTSTKSLFIIGTDITNCKILDCEINSLHIGNHRMFNNRMVSNVKGLLIEDCVIRDRIRVVEAYVDDFALKSSDITGHWERGLVFQKCTVSSLVTEGGIQTEFIRSTTNNPDMAGVDGLTYFGNGCELENRSNLWVSKKVFDFDLSNAKMRGCAFKLNSELVKNSNIRHSILASVDFEFMLFYVRSKETWDTEVPFFEGVDFEGSYLSLSVMSRIPWYNKKGTKLSDIEQAEADDVYSSFKTDIGYSTFKKCSFRKATILRLSQNYIETENRGFAAILEDCDMHKCLVVDPRFKNVDWEATYIGSDRETPIHGKDLSGIRMFARWENLTFTKCDLSELIVDGHLDHMLKKGWRVESCTFTDCRLDRLKIHKFTTFEECSFENCTFDGLIGSEFLSFEDCRFVGCRFSGDPATLRGVYFDDCSFTDVDIPDSPRYRIFD